MSFVQLDEAPPRYEEAPDAAPERPRRPPRATGPERRALVRRRIVALVVALGLLALLVVATRGCLDWQADRAYTEYARDAGAVAVDSLHQSESLFELLRGGEQKDPIELQNSVNGFRAQADLLVDRARNLDVPDRFGSANRFLVYALEFRRDGLAQLGRELPTALGENDREEANGRIAEAMRSFLVSDVLYSQRLTPDVGEALRERDLPADSDLPGERFLPTIDWLRESTVSDRLSELREGPGEVAAGARGLGLGVVTAGGETLSASSPTQLRASTDLAFSVQLQNQGSVPEEQVEVTVSVTGGSQPMSVERVVPTIPAGGSETATIPLADTPPAGRSVTVKVRVKPAQGETRTDDNESSFPATFSAS
ncbi:MAG TPA: CARDB domain-containing protein [Thermoleophilaceae bacterium]|nr:CARDB domain-containing protein [Thermoleophilaceae bacterium]